MYVWLTEPYLVVSHHDTMKKNRSNMRKNEFQSNKNYAHSVLIYVWIPMVRVQGMLQCAKYQSCTRTRGTHDLITVGIPVPMTNPTPE
jgi:hypothetical protein